MIICDIILDMCLFFVFFRSGSLTGGRSLSCSAFTLGFAAVKVVVIQELPFIVMGSDSVRKIVTEPMQYYSE